MYRSTKKLLGLAMALFLLVACAPAQLPAPTVDVNEIENQVSTSVALTVAAQNTQTAVARPTDTPIPSPTEVVELPSPTLVLPTATPFVVVPPTTVSNNGSGGGVTVTKPDYDCDIIRRRPLDETYFKPNDSFDIKWTIINTGTKTLRAGTDVKYSIGDKMTATNFVELPEMKPGDQYEIVLDAVAPQKEGHHVMTWVVEGPLCYPYVSIIVEK